MPALVALCSSPCFVRGADWRFGVSPEIFRDFAQGLADDYRATLDRFVALEAFGSDHAKEELRELRAELFARGEPAARVLVDGLRILETSGPASVAVATARAQPVDRRSPRPPRRSARDARCRRADRTGRRAATFAQIEHMRRS